LEESIANKKSGSVTRKKKRGILADEDGLIELEHRLTLEKARYLALKEITPDYQEPPSAGDLTVRERSASLDALL
jgi:hypothetical protein